MKLIKVIFTILILLLTFQFCFGQEKPKAELIDKFSYESNDPLQARIFNLISAVKKSNSKGYIIIHSSTKDSLDKYLYERRIKNCFRWAKLPDKNFVIVLGEDRNDFEVELWKVPNGADKPQFTETRKDYVVTSLSKPKLIHKLQWNEEYCPLYFDLQFYSKFLKVNPNLVGRIIIREKKLSNFNKVKQELTRQLTITNKVSKTQLEFVKDKIEYSEDVEYWFVLKNK